MIYLDNASTTIQKPSAVHSSLSALSMSCGNPSRSSHQPSMKSSSIIFDTRSKICELFNFPYQEKVIFTYNATYALNLAIKGFITSKCNVLTSGYEHNSTIRPLISLKKIGVETKIIPSRLYDHHEFLVNFKNSIDSETKYAVINHVSNVFGYILPIKEIDQICHEHGIKLILDCSQSAGIIDIDLSGFKSVIAVCMPGHKSLYGVLGVGVLVIIEDPVKQTVLQGGTGSVSQSMLGPDFLPDMLEVGTPNVVGIGALGHGIDYVMSKKNIAQHVFNLARYTSEQLSKIADTTVFFKDDIALQSGVVSFTHKKTDTEVLSSALASHKICTRAGYHCSPLAHDSAGTDGTVRVSFSSFNTFAEVDKFIEIYKKLAR